MTKSKAMAITIQILIKLFQNFQIKINLLAIFIFSNNLQNNYFSIPKFKKIKLILNFHIAKQENYPLKVREKTKANMI